MRKNQSINVVVRFTHAPHRGAGFIGQALLMFNKPVLPVSSIEGNIIEELSGYNDMLNKLSDYNDMLNKLSDYTVNIFIEYRKRDLIYA
jgi:hypothetical protein